MKNIISNLKHDLPASIVVFLVALPLCLGVALASGSSMLSGILAGIVGGIVVGLLSGSQSSVSGPAAGLTAVVLSSIIKLGSFETFLLALIIAGALQVIGGVVKAGIVANYIPSNIIKGLLAAIGIILILKQIPHAVGLDIDNQDDFTFFQQDGENTFTELIKIFSFFNGGAFLVCLLSMLVLIYWDRTPLKKIKFFPASILVVIISVLLNELFKNFIPLLSIQPSHLVNIPRFTGLASLITLPSFENFFNYNVWVVALTLAIVASLETLLNLEAVDNLDIQKRKSPPNRELIAQGIGNMLSGLIGGIPVTSVIVRSSVNINSGSATKLSTILHGFFLLISILALAPVLNLIPLSCLAAILMVTGYKLANISLFKEMYKKGFSQFIPFLITILAIVFTDLLIGIVIGSFVSVLFLLKSNYNNPFTIKKEHLYQGETLLIDLPNQVSFLNKSRIKETLWNIPTNSKVIIDATHCDFIDHDVLEIIKEFKITRTKERNILLNILGLKKVYHINDLTQFVNIVDKEMQEKLKPIEVLKLLKYGNQRFVNGTPVKKNLIQQVNATYNEQHPIAVILSCIDSRTSAELIFDLSIGDVFSVRIAGNVVNEDILGSIEFGCKLAGAKLIIVMGHTNCGAIKGACDHLEIGKLSALLNKIQPAIINEKTIAHNRNSGNKEFVEKVTVLNVKETVNSIFKQSAILKEMIENGEIGIAGGLHNLETGKVTFLNETMILEGVKK
jgi:MFS superfamily sulfate permease-like transporter